MSSTDPLYTDSDTTAYSAAANSVELSSIITDLVHVYTIVPWTNGYESSICQKC